MNNTKAWWQSRTIWVALVSVLFAILGGTGVLPEGLTEDGVVETIMGIIGILIVVFRIGATDAIGKTNK